MYKQKRRFWMKVIRHREDIDDMIFGKEETVFSDR